MTYGGTDTFVINLCKGLVHNGYDVTVVLSTDPSKQEVREKELADTGVRIVKTCSLQGGIKAKLRHLKLLYQELRNGKYDVFQTNIDLFNGPQMLVSWLAGVPIRECHSHNSEQGRELHDGRTWKVRLYQTVMRWLCWNFSNRRGGCSEAALDFLFQNKWHGDSHSSVIHNGIDLQKYQNELDSSEKRKMLGISQPKVVCTVGRISFQKNPEFLLNIFYELRKIRNDVALAWCGTGEEQEKIKAQIHSYGLEECVYLLGARTDISEILQCSDVFFLPSRFEGLGIVLVEAQVAGLQCIMSDVIPAEVDCGLCIPISLNEEPAKWADRMCKVLDGSMNAMLDDEKLRKYSVEYMIEEMEALFR